MVLRRPSFSKHWSEPDISFGPLPRSEAEKMVASKWGGRIVSLAVWHKGER